MACRRNSPPPHAAASPTTVSWPPTTLLILPAVDGSSRQSLGFGFDNDGGDENDFEQSFTPVSLCHLKQPPPPPPPPLLPPPFALSFARVLFVSPSLKLKSSPFPTLPYHEPSPTPTPTPPSQKPPSTKPKIPIHASSVISDSRSLSGGSDPSKSNPRSKNTGLSRTGT
uniref:Uncharacterized protein n=1 Tax=Fagus sylvatica TaxID=28930 RepID=A0A2N9J2G7_FAGSY